MSKNESISSTHSHLSIKLPHQLSETYTCIYKDFDSVLWVSVHFSFTSVPFNFFISSSSLEHLVTAAAFAFSAALSLMTLLDNSFSIMETFWRRLLNSAGGIASALKSKNQHVVHLLRNQNNLNSNSFIINVLCNLKFQTLTELTLFFHKIPLTSYFPKKDKIHLT